MKVLALWPPQVPSYFNAGHHIGVFLNAAYLRGAGHDVTALDAGALNYDWKRFGDLIRQQRFDVIAITNDFDNVDDFDRVLRYVRALSPRTRVVTAGRLSIQAPLVFEATDVDAIVVSGDPEAGIADYMAWLEHGGPAPDGITVRVDGTWQRPARSGRYLPADEWQLPDIGEIPYGAYLNMYKRDESKFCGIPDRRELVVPAARGCPVGCSFCDVPGVQGLRDRRLTVSRTINYIEASFASQPFEYVAFYAPTFTLHRRWIQDLCAELVARGSRYPWKCATTIAHTPLDLLERMAESGCVRVSVGLETLDPDSQGMLPRQKHIELNRFHTLAGRCRELGVELNCFVIAGLPGTTAAGVRRTVREIRAAGGRVRPTMYGNIEALRVARTLDEAALFNRQLLHPDDAVESEDTLYDIVFGVEPNPTQVMSAIPRRTDFAVS